MAVVETLAQSPRPLGSRAHQQAREYLVRELTALGFAVEVQPATVASQLMGWIRGATVHNIVARRRGTSAGGALLLSAHYDSVNHAPGAADDAAGVATLLEAGRALSHGPPLQHDLILLITDAEELGLLGATAWMREHRWVKDVKLVLNFEARGASGPSVLFETSTGNGGLIAAFAQVAPAPLATSLVSALSKLLPNDTDLTILGRNGVAAMNFAFADELERYHTVTDDPAHLDRGSLQHHGSYAVSLVRYFDQHPQALKPQPNRVYFDVLQSVVVHYPEEWAPLFGGLLLVLWWIVWRAARSERAQAAAPLTRRGVLKEAVLFILFLLVATAVIQALAAAVSAFADRQVLLAYAPWLWWGYLGIALGLALAFWRWRTTRPRGGAAQVALGTLAVAALAGLVTGLWAPAASYFFHWPSALALLILGLRLAPPREGPLWRWVLHLPALLLGILAWGMVYMVFVMDGGLNPGAPTFFALWALGLTTWQLLEQPVPKALPWAAGVTLLGGLYLLTAVSLVGPSPEHPRLTLLHYGLDADTGEAVWIGPAEEPLQEWGPPALRHGVVGHLPQFTVIEELLRHAPAPALPLAPPRLEVVAQGPSGPGERSLELRLRSMRGASCVTMWRESGGRVRHTSLQERQLASVIRFSAQTDAQLAELVFGRARAAWKLYFCGLPPEGLQLRLVTDSEPVVFRVVDESLGLPPELGLPPRPPHLAPSPRSDLTFVSRRVEL